MNSQILELRSFALDEAAKKYFTKICGFDHDEKKYRRMMDRALLVHQSLDKQIRPQAVLSYYDDEIIDGKYLYIVDVEFECMAFEQIKKQNVIGVYAYILTAGNLRLENCSQLDKFYTDTWGTAYVDASRDILRQYISNQYKSDAIFVSDSFGPGYYGMQTTNIKNFFKIIDGAKIGVELYGNEIMLPLKSCAGFFVVSKEQELTIGADCKYCLGQGNGCEFCRARTQIQ